MEKKKIINFITKYNLAGLCNQVKITCKDDKMLTSFATDQKDLLGFVMVNKVGISDSPIEFGIFNTGVITKILGVMQSDINISFNEEHGKLTAMQIKDDVFSSQIMLADLDIIENPPSINEVPPTDIKLNLNSSTIEQFVKAKNALSESEILAFNQNGSGVDLIINYAEHNTDTMTLKMTVDQVNGDIPVMKFNANLIKEVFVANKDCESGVIELSSQGLLTVTFKGDNFQSKYLMVMLQD